MITIERRLDVKLTSSIMLAEYMRLRGFTVRTLADAVERELQKRKYTAKDGQKTCKHATIGHLRSGERDNASTNVAIAISEVLDAPLSSLFSAKVSTVHRDTRRSLVSA